MPDMIPDPIPGDGQSGDADDDETEKDLRGQP